MGARFTPDQIRDHWASQAREHGQSPKASWSDQMVVEMEIREILRHLADGDRVLDAGCANGYSTMRFAEEKRLEILGLDFIPEMIEQARQRLGQWDRPLAGKASFQTGDVTSLELPPGSFDKVVVIRVIINLASWESQQRGLRECARMLKPGGLLLLSEATVQGWRQLNAFRQEWGLPEIPMPPFNHYLDQQQVVDTLAPELELLEIADFASTYYVGTRVVKPLLIQALGARIDAARPDMHWNRWFSQLPPAGDYGTQKLFHFRKR